MQSANQRIFGQPFPMSAAEKLHISTCVVAPGPMASVIRHGQLLGHVMTHGGMQRYKPVGTCDWVIAATDWSLEDPIHGKALLELTRYHHNAMPLAA